MQCVDAQVDRTSNDDVVMAPSSPPPLYSNPHPNVSVERPTLPPDGGRYVSGLLAKSPPCKVPWWGGSELYFFS